MTMTDPMDPIAGVSFLQGDFRDDAVLEALLERIQPSMVDVVILLVALVVLFQYF